MAYARHVSSVYYMLESEYLGKLFIFRPDGSWLYTFASTDRQAATSSLAMLNHKR